MKYILIILFAIFITSCGHRSNVAKGWTIIKKDMGKGWEEIDTADSKDHQLLEAFSYDKLSKFKLKYEEFYPGDTFFFVGKQDYYVHWNHNALCITKFPFRGDEVFIFGKQYDLQSLYFTLTKPDSLSKIYVDGCSAVTSGNKNYFLFYVSSETREMSRGVLIDLASPDTLIKFPLLQLSTTPLCLNDFDQDGILDHADVDLEKGRISCYHLIKDQFVLDKNHYVSLKPFEDHYIIDKDSSNWFFKL